MTISKNLYPISGRYFTEDRNNGRKRHENIINNRPGHFHQILTAGMMAGMSNKSREWFDLELTDRDLMEFKPVKVWLGEATQVIRDIFAGSNFYQGLAQVYEEDLAFGQACTIMKKDFKDMIRLYPSTVGEYFLGHNNRFEVDTIYREFDMQVGPIIQEFGLTNVSQKVKDQYNKGNYDTWFTVVHAPEPRTERDPTKIDNRNMPFLSVYYERDEKNNRNPLRESGFRNFPALAPRWHARGGDVYGTGPGWYAVDDAMELQADEYRWAETKDYKTKPPLQIPNQLKGTADTLPGGESFYDQVTPHGGIRTAFNVDFDTRDLLLGMDKKEQRIKEEFFADLFLAVLRDDRRQQTAREVEEKHEEKLIILGPTLERHQNEVFEPAIENTFAWALEENLLPPVPDELRGRELKARYTSMLAQAQRAVGIGSMDRIIGTTANMEAGWPGTRHKLNPDEVVEIYAEMLGVPPQAVVSNEKAVFIRKREAEAAGQAQEQEALAQAAQTGKVLSETDTDKPSVLRQISEQLEVAA